MAPEVIRGEPPTRASDLYSAGVILYELLTATTPFGGGAAAEIAARHLYEDIEPPSLRRPDRAIATAFDELVLRALAKRPAARFADAATFARELRAAARRAQLNPRMPNGRHGRARPDIAPAATDSRRNRIEQLKELRCLLGDALARDDVAQIADGYLAVAQLLRSERRFAAAVQQLEEGIDLLTAGQDDRGRSFGRGEPTEGRIGNPLRSRCAQILRVTGSHWPSLRGRAAAGLEPSWNDGCSEGVSCAPFLS